VANKNVSSWIFLGAAVLAGGLAFWLSHLYLNSQAEKARKELSGGEVKMVAVVVASKDLTAGDVITQSNVSVGKLPAAHVSRRAIAPDKFPAIKDHVVNRALSSGEPVMADDVAGAYAERFSDLLKPGERAITIEASDLSSNAGLLLPGDVVDLFILLKSEGNGAGNKSKTLLPLMEGVRVLAAGSTALQAADQKYQALSAKSARYGTITVGLPLDRAEKVLVARDMGELAFVMRNSADITHNVTSFASSANLFGGGYRYFSSATPSGVRRIPSSELNEEGAASRSMPIEPMPATAIKPVGDSSASTTNSTTVGAAAPAGAAAPVAAATDSKNSNSKGE